MIYSSEPAKIARFCFPAVFPLVAVLLFLVPRAANSMDNGSVSTARGLTIPFLTSPQSPPLSTEEVLRLIKVSAEKNNVPASFVQSIVAAESNFNSAALSPKGAIGLMQLMPETAKLYDANPWIAEQNVDAGAHYLRDLMDRYAKKCRNSLPRVIAAYNAGPGMVDKYRGIPPFRETRQYVVRVLGFLRKFNGGLRNTGRF
jgi:soluble lytic murein transglycosylase-like protein